jgi:hypothetical protein
MVVNAILWITGTGAQWRNMNSEYTNYALLFLSLAKESGA